MAGKVKIPDSPYDLPFIPTIHQLLAFTVGKTKIMTEKEIKMQQFLKSTASSDFPITTKVSGILFEHDTYYRSYWLQTIIKIINDKLVNKQRCISVKNQLYYRYIITTDGVLKSNYDGNLIPIMFAVTSRPEYTIDKIADKEEGIQQCVTLLYDSYQVNTQSPTFSTYLKKVIKQYQRFGFKTIDDSERLSKLFKQGYATGGLANMDIAKDHFIDYLIYNLK